MNVFCYNKENVKAIVLAFNRGHAVKLLAKELESKGMTLEKSDKVEEIDQDDKKGRVFLITG